MRCVLFHIGSDTIDLKKCYDLKNYFVASRHSGVQKKKHIFIVFYNNNPICAACGDAFILKIFLPLQLSN